VRLGCCQELGWKAEKHLPFTSGESASFLRGKDGRIVCRHGRLRASVVHMRAVRSRRARCSCMAASFPTRLATRAFTSPEKRNSAAKRKRASAGEMRTTPVCEHASTTALAELPTDTSSDDGDAAMLGPQVLTEDVAMDVGKAEGVFRGAGGVVRCWSGKEKKLAARGVRTTRG
jgi:hypothetical protein